MWRLRGDTTELYSYLPIKGAKLDIKNKRVQTSLALVLTVGGSTGEGQRRLRETADLLVKLGGPKLLGADIQIQTVRTHVRRSNIVGNDHRLKLVCLG